MRRIITLLCFAFVAINISAQTLLDTFIYNIKQLGTYTVEFKVELDKYTASGYYVVQDNNFYASVDGVEYYLVDGVKYEVNPKRGEVVVDSAESMGSDLLSNPAQGFAFLAAHYNAADTIEAGAKAVRLTPKQGGAAGESIVIKAQPLGRLPESITYNYDAATMTINLLKIASWQGELPRFDMAKYAQYELIDMR